ncbi:MAG: macB [Gammaproteobacteria bacterium]|nr:macB [Gammaproteobacteria bacterium]MCE3238331.1 macB [Gammaproteobacteria bacterium]
MKLINHLQTGFSNLLAFKLRSILALLGILVGTASVVGMVSGGELATNEALRQFKTLGTDLLAISVSDSSEKNTEAAGSFNQLLLPEAINIGKADPGIIDVAPYSQVYNTMQFDGHTLDGSVLGVTENFARIVHVDVEKGRFISLLDGYAFFCVIGNKINEQIKKLTFQDAIGQQIQIGKNIFTIVGVAKPWPENSFVYADINNTVMVPILTSISLSKYASINNIILRLTSDAVIEDVQKNITNYINGTVANKRLFFRSAKELIARMSKQSQILTVFLGLIGSISLLVGGIGVMNIMLVSVVERRREIGVRLAVGAKRSDIWALFLSEAIMLSFIGGTCGVMIGMMIAYTMALVWHWQFTLFLLPPLIGFSVSVVIGIFFGFYPAYKASRLDPIEALRSE